MTYAMHMQAAEQLADRKFCCAMVGMLDEAREAMVQEHYHRDEAKRLAEEGKA